MATKAKKKRKWTQAMKDAFARRMKRARNAKKGGATTKKKRKPVAKKSKVSASRPAKKKVIRKGATTMAKKKISSSSGDAKKTRRRRRSFGSGGGGVMKHVQGAAIAIGGGVVSSMIANKLPIPNPIAKAAVPLAIGAGLIMTIGKKKPMVSQMATGMMVLGGLAMIRAAAPNIPLLAGEEEVVVTPEMLGYNDEDISGYNDEDISGYDDEDLSGLGIEDLSGPVDLMGAGGPVGNFRTAAMY